MTNGELFIKENPNIEFKINGSCVWIYFDGINHYTMPVKWWDKEIDVFNKIRAEIEQIADEEQKHDEKWAIGLRYAVKIIGKYKAESEG